MSAQTLVGLADLNKLRQILPACSAILLGSLLLLTVGFSPIEVVHNTAHDTRHTANFPCH